MATLSEESTAKLTTRITDLVRREVQLESQLAEAAKMPGANLSQELVSVRAQLSVLRWVPTVTRAAWKARQNEVERQDKVVEPFFRALTHPADGPASQATHELLLCLHGQSCALNWALLVLKEESLSLA